jgi:hypothetical protein
VVRSWEQFAAVELLARIRVQVQARRVRSTGRGNEGRRVALAGGEAVNE